MAPTSVETVFGARFICPAAAFTEMPGLRPTSRTNSACELVSPVSSKDCPALRRIWRRKRPDRPEQVADQGGFGCRRAHAPNILKQR